MWSSLYPALAAALAAAAVWVGYAFSEARTRRRFAALERAWRAYAAEHGLAVVSFAELSGVPGDVGPPLVRGELSGVALELTVHSSTRPVTCVAATLPGVSRSFVLTLRRRRGRLPRSFDGSRVEEAKTGNKAFDTTFALLSNEPDLARSLVDRRLAQVVLAFPGPSVDLSVRENRFVVSWRGMESAPPVLDAAIEVVFTACRRRA